MLLIGGVTLALLALLLVAADAYAKRRMRSLAATARDLDRLRPLGNVDVLQ